MKSFSEYVIESNLTEESALNVKGWVNGSKRKMVMWKAKQKIRPYHTEHLSNNPEKYGLKELDLLKVLADSYGFDTDDEEVTSTFAGMKSGRFDRDKDLDGLMYKNGWVRVVFNNGISSIESPVASDMHSAAKLIGKKYSWSQIEYMDIGEYLTGKSESIGDEQAWNIYLKTGRVPKRTSIGSTMARFREHIELSESYRGDMLIGWIDPKGKPHIYPTGKGTTYHTQILTNIVPFEEMEKHIPDAVGSMLKKHNVTGEKAKKAIETHKRIQYDKMNDARVDSNRDVEHTYENMGWVKFRIDRVNCCSSIQNKDLKRCHNAAKILDKKLGGWQGISTIRIYPENGRNEINDEKTWDTYIKTGRIPKRTEIGQTMSKFRGTN